MKTRAVGFLSRRRFFLPNYFGRYIRFYEHLLKIVGITLLLLTQMQFSNAQGIGRVTGSIIDNEGNSLANVTVSAQSPSGVMIASQSTGEKGTFELKALPTNQKIKLVFTSVGFKPHEINDFLVQPNDNNSLLVTLESEQSGIDEIVVVAFGKQKRTDMVGSVVSVNPSELKVPASNLTTALAGRVAGVVAFQRSGEPGQDNADFFVRGVTTFGYKRDPLVLIDGVEVSTTDLARLQVDDITSFSVLKDATATALYGSRAANGVIVVSTKSGFVGKTRLSLRLENSVSQPTQNVELADPVSYMKLHNEAVLTRNPLGAVLYSDRKIENTVIGAGSVLYPANDWREIMFKDYTMNQRANVSLSGGGGIARYYVSGAINRDNGLMKIDKRNNFNNNISLSSYTLRSNVNINLTKTSELVVRLSGNFDDYIGPIDGGTTMYNKVMRANPVLFPAFYPAGGQYAHVQHIMFGNFDDGSYINPYADMVKGYKEYSRSVMLAQLELNQNLDFITKGLSFNTMGNTNRRSYFDVVRSYNPFWYSMIGQNAETGAYYLTNINESTGTEYLGYREGPTNVSSLFYFDAKLNYSRAFGKHGFSGLLVSMLQTQLDANAGNLQRSLPYRNFGVSGRMTYDYDKRYYTEFNFGYNGSERFDSNHRFGFFPSAGVAWTASNEKFFENLKDIVTNLRFRATYGLIGNDAIGSPDDRFFYLSNVNMNNSGRGAVFGRDPGSQYALNGISISRYANPNITWELSKQRNFAIELGLFNKLTLNAEYFNQYRSQILMPRASIPVEAGFEATIQANLGEASAQGVDLSLDYKQSFFNGAWISGLGNFTYAKGIYRVFEEPKYNEYYRYRVGNSINQQYGYIAERLFIDDREAKSSPSQNFGEYGGGDIKYLDINRDGRITEADRVPIGNPTVPEIAFGFGFSGGYKSFDVSAFFQGVANTSFWIDAAGTSPFNNNNQLLKAYADSYWSEDSQDIFALWPRLSTNVNTNNTQRSTWFMRDGAFLRLKQVEIGYSLPRRIQERLKTTTFRLYVNASNLFSFSRFGLWDVEMGDNGLGYPLQRVFNLGINMNIN